MILVEALMGIGFMCVLALIGYACFKLGRFLEKKDPK
jgi:hypothetical protein